MSYRPHGRAKVSSRNPRAWGVCDFCGAIYNRDELQWQYEWAGPRIVNQNMLVCESCYDTPQEQLRSIVLPTDPVPIDDPRIERYVLNDNPVSPLGTNIGSLLQGAGLQAAFDSNANKPFGMSAVLFTSTLLDTNYVGKSWVGMDPNNPTQGVTARRFVATAPNNASFLGAGTTVYAFQGSDLPVGWTTLYTGTTTGVVGEIIDVTLTPTDGYLYHRFVITGDGITSASVAQLIIDNTG